MSTRSTTHFLNSDGTLEAIIYRHSDGYPEGAGVDLLAFLEHLKENLGTDARFADPSYLAAKYVVFLATLFNRDYSKPNDFGYSSKDNKFDFLSVGIVKEDPEDIEFRYTVTCNGDMFNNKTLPKVVCQETGSNKTVTIPKKNVKARTKEFNQIFNQSQFFVKG